MTSEITQKSSHKRKVLYTFLMPAYIPGTTQGRGVEDASGNSGLVPV